MALLCQLDEWSINIKNYYQIIYLYYWTKLKLYKNKNYNNNNKKIKNEDNKYNTNNNSSPNFLMCWKKNKPWK